MTDNSGVATLQNVSLAGINAGTYSNGIQASFAGDTNYLSSSGTGTLNVLTASQQANTLIQEVKALVPVPLNAVEGRVLTYFLSLTGRKVVNVVKVDVFIVLVKVLQNAGILTQAQANPLILGADMLLVSLKLG